MDSVSDRIRNELEKDPQRKNRVIAKLAKAKHPSQVSVIRKEKPEWELAKKKAKRMAAANGQQHQQQPRVTLERIFEFALDVGGIDEAKNQLSTIKENKAFAFAVECGGIEKAQKALERGERKLEKLKQQDEQSAKRGTGRNSTL